MYKKMRLFLLVPALISVLLLSACTNSVEFTINFDSNGGSEVSSIKTDGTSSITLPNDPIKDGYSFAGWYWDNSTFRDLFTVNSLLERGISGNLTVYAKWNKEDTPIGAIKVTFNSMGGSEVNPQYVQKDNTIAIPNTSKVGYTLDGWYTSLNNGQTFDEKWSFTNNKVTTDITLYAKWIINQYTITFNSNGGSSVSSITQDYDTLVIAPVNPTKLGYTFSGWSQPVPIKMPAEDVTLIAEWSINQYTITFNSNGGSPVTAITQDYATTVSKPTDPTKVGYTFAGWYINISLTTPYTFTTMPAQNITLYAKWVPLAYNINYELADGLNHLSNPSSYTIETNTIILSSPTKEGYTFEGWYSDSNFTNYVSEITIGSIGNLTLYAKWNINSYNINYYILPDDYDPLKDILLAPGETIIQVSLGEYHSAALTSNGRLFTWGSNWYGQLGDGTTTDKSTPTEITSRFILATGDKIIQVSLGEYHSAALTSSGRLFTWGDNNYGQLGDGTYSNRTTPTEITSRFILATGDKIIQVSSGDYHSAALTSSGRLFTWGYNVYGQLGDGTSRKRTTPTEITSRFSLATGDKIIQVSLGGYRSAALTSSGRLFTWGNNYYGILGDGTTFDRSTPTEITSRFILATGDKIIQVSLGDYHSAALTSSGRLFTWGYNEYGQLGDGTTTYRSTPTEITNRFSLATGDKIIQVSLGTYHSAALTSNGRLFTWGRNDNGQLGDGTYSNKSTPTEITNRFSLATGDKIIQVSLGGSRSAALTSSGRLFTWGYNELGQLGDGTTTNRSTPTEITQAHYELHSDTVIYNQSIMEYVPLRDGYTFSGWYSDINLKTPYIFGSMPAEDVTLIAEWSINQYTITFDSNGGSPVTAIEQDYATTISKPTDPTKGGYTFAGWYINSSLTTAYTFTTMPAEDITLYAKWIPNSYTAYYNIQSDNQYLLADILLLPGETIIQVSLGYAHSAALTSSGRLFTWGYNYSGQLGDGTTTNKSTPTEITSRFNLVTGDKIIQVSLGGSHSSALTSSGRLFTWGYNYSGQLGDGTTTNKSTPTEITSRFNLVTGDKIIQVSLGTKHSAALTSSGRLFTWGYNYSGQLGDGTDTNRSTPTEITSRFSLSTGDKIISVSLGGYHSAALTSNGRLFIWGRNDSGQLGDGTTTHRSTPTEITNRFSLATGDKIIRVSLGNDNSAALTSSGRLFTWGDNQYGQLGDGATTRKSTPTEITNRFSLATGDKIIQVSLGDYHSAALTSNGRLFIWGYNGDGQLGDGTNTNRYSPTQITQAHYELLHFDTVIYNQSITEYVPTREGYTFSGWYSDINLKTPYIFGSMPAEDITLHGKWVSND